MSNANGIITAPVSLHGDVASVLGLGTYDLAALCQSSKIKKWALFKPVKHTKIGILSETEKKGYDGQCGYEILHSTVGSCSREIEEVLAGNGSYDWSYIHPNGGTYPFRLLDFEHYNDNSINPFASSNVDYTAGMSDVLGIVLPFNYDAWNVQYNFTPDQLIINGSSCANWYAGVIVVSKSDSDYAIQALVTDTVTLDKTYGSLYFNLNCAAMNKGEYYVIPVLCSANRSGSNAYYRITGSSLPTNDMIAFMPSPYSSLYVISPAEAYIYPQVVVGSNGGINISTFATNNGEADIISPKITLTVEYLLDTEDNDSWSDIYKADNYVMERGDMPAGEIGYELRDEYFYIDSAKVPSSIQLGANKVMRVTIDGVSPSFLGTTQLQFYYNVGTYTDYTVN